jgi:hypothetical protein
MGLDAAKDVLFDGSFAVGADSFCGCEDSVAPDAGLAGAALRVLKENFFGGLNELRVAWSFSARSLIF